MEVMEIVRIILLCVVLPFICLAMDTLDNKPEKQALEIQEPIYDMEENSLQTIRQKRNDLNHPLKIVQTVPKVSPKRILNLRLDTMPRKQLTTRSPTTKTRAVPKVTQPILKGPLPISKKENLKVNDINRLIPKISKPENLQKAEDKLVKPTQHFFEDDEEPEINERPKLKENKYQKVIPKAKKKEKLYPLTVIETKSDNDGKSSNNDIPVKLETNATHVELKIGKDVSQNITDAKSGTFQERNDDNIVQYRSDNLYNLEPGLMNGSDIEVITLAGTKYTKNQKDDKSEDRDNIKMVIEESNKNDHKNEPNSIIISKQGFEEIRERSPAYTVDTTNIKQPDPINSIPNWNYPYYNPYDNIELNCQNDIPYNYQIKTEAYEIGPDMTYNPIEVKSNTDRIWRTWKNTEIRISNDRFCNQVNVNTNQKYVDDNDMNVVKTPYCYRTEPVIGNGYYGNNNIAAWQCYTYPGYR